MVTLEHIGWGVFAITWILIFSKGIRSNRRVAIMLVVTGIFACEALIIRDYYHREFDNEADYLISPFISAFLYSLLRFLFKSIKGVEPTFVGQHSWNWFDEEDGRNMTFFDVIVFLVPFWAGVYYPMIM